MSPWIIILLIVIVVISLLLFFMSFKFVEASEDYKRQRIRNIALEQDLEKMQHDVDTDWKERYEALEVGADEQQENYEQMYLSLSEQVGRLTSNLSQSNSDTQTLFKIAERHADHCIPRHAPGLSALEYETLNHVGGDLTKYHEQYLWALSQE